MTAAAAIAAVVDVRNSRRFTGSLLLCSGCSDRPSSVGADVELLRNYPQNPHVIRSALFHPRYRRLAVPACLTKLVLGETAGPSSTPDDLADSPAVGIHGSRLR